MNPILKLYYADGSCSTASHIALEESGEQFEPQRIRLHQPDDPTGYRKINPSGTVPALSVDGVIVTENVAILTYIARRFPEARLFPEDLLGQARCTSLLAWFACSVHITFRQYRGPQLFGVDESMQPALSQAGSKAFWANVEKLDAMLATNHWLLGDQFTVADCYALIFYGWGLATGLEMTRLPAYTAFKERMLIRPATRRALERERHILLGPAAAKTVRHE